MDRVRKAGDIFIDGKERRTVCHDEIEYHTMVEFHIFRLSYVSSTIDDGKSVGSK